MDRIECMRAFIEVVRHEGFTAAARALEVPRSKISKQVQALEEAIGVQLLARTTRSLHLTEAGTEYFESARELVAELDEIEQRAREGTRELRGILRVNVPLSFGIRKLSPLIPLFHAENPQIELQVVLSDQQIDPVRGGFDVTIRIASLPDSSLIARTLAPARHRIVAAPAYLEKAGTPREPEELSQHAFLSYGYLQNGVSLSLCRDGKTRHIRVSGPLHTNNGDFLAQAAEHGMGIAMLPTFIIDQAVAEGRLVPLLEDWQGPPISINAVYPASRQLPQKSRIFIDFLRKHLAES